MRLFRLMSGLAASVMCLVAMPVPADEVELTPYLAAGKLLFEETAGDTGCEVCHGHDATGTELAPDIRGKDEVAIIQNLSINANMDYLALSTEDIEHLAAYLAYLEENPLR